MASRYGSLKQLDGFGPNGETIIDYSIHDAIRAGFGKIIFIIRQSIADEFKAVMQSRLPAHIPVVYVAQELDMLPTGYEVPAGREKPWGTGHAVWVASRLIAEPFAVINADDFYGYESFRLVVDFLQNSTLDHKHGLVGFTLSNTLSEHGSVSRGICSFAPDNSLSSLTELTKIVQSSSGEITVQDEGATCTQLQGDEIVSMNLMAFKPTVFPYFEKYLKEFLNDRGQELKAEFYLPAVVNKMIAHGEAQVRVLPSPERWFGVTYPDDKPTAIARIKELVDSAVYPENLWTTIP